MVRDRRRIDPTTGERRTPAPEETGLNGQGGTEGDAAAGPGAGGPVIDSISGTLDDELVAEAADSAEAADAAAPADTAEAAEQSALQRKVDELTADLKRVTAEYANYRKRVERDRESVVASAKASVAGSLLTVLDDLERADTHGDLTGPFKAVADKLVETLRGSGLESFGEEGEEFDPSVHEAVQHTTSPDVSGPTVSAVLRRGYRFGDRVLRPAMVAVTDHEPNGSGPVEQVSPDKANADQASTDQVSADEAEPNSASEQS